LIDVSRFSDDANTAKAGPQDGALFDAHGRNFHAAWKALRENKQYFFFITNLGYKAEGRGDGRAAYLAKSFSEFCAESFMHFVVERNGLLEHVQSLADEPTTPREVNAAWSDAIAVLRHSRIGSSEHCSSRIESAPPECLAGDERPRAGGVVGGGVGEVASTVRGSVGPRYSRRWLCRKMSCHVHHPQIRTAKPSGRRWRESVGRRGRGCDGCAVVVGGLCGRRRGRRSG